MNYSPRTVKTARRRIHPVLLAGLVVLLLAVSLLGFYRGSENEVRSKLRAVTDETVQQRKQLDKCRVDEGVLIAAHTRDNDAAQKQKDLRDEVAELQEQNAELDIKMRQCDDEVRRLEEKKAQQTDAEQAVQAKIQALKKRSADLETALRAAIGSEGSQGLEERLSLEKSRNEYVERCSRIPGCVVKTFAELRTAPSGGVATTETTRGPSGDNASVSLAPTFSTFFTPTSEGFGDVHLITGTAADGALPTAFNRTMGKSYFAEEGLPAGGPQTDTSATFAEQVTLLEDAALCAHRHGKPNVHFPSAFYFDKDRTRTALLHEAVTTPLVLFCRNCSADAVLMENAATCATDRTEQLYGSHAFWVARSLVRSTRAVSNAAYEFYDTRELVGTRTLAVVLRPEAGVDCSENADTLRQGHYRYLTEAFPNDKAVQTHMGVDQASQCTPNGEEIAQYIESIDDFNGEFNAIILSMSVGMRKSVMEAFKARENEHLSARVTYFDADEHMPPMTAEAVDLEIASRATEILVSSFFPSSRYVTESFLLRNGLSPAGKVRFF